MIASLAWRSASAAADAAAQARVVRDHRVACDGVAHRPQAHDQGFGSREHEGAAETVHAFTVADFADAGVAGGQRDQPSAPQIEARRLERRQDAAAGRDARQVGPREGEARSQQRILDDGA
jgi:hypothetical protein